MRYLIPIVGLLLLVFLHELGHFVAAKRTGMRALRFFVGFPPPLLSRQIGDTEYGIGMVPLGGFVKIPGMLRPEPADLWAVDDLLHRGEKLPEADAAAIGIQRDQIASLRIRRQHLLHRLERLDRRAIQHRLDRVGDLEQ